MEQSVNFFVAFFAQPSILGIGLAIAFGALWLAGYWPPLFSRHWLWAVLVSGAVLTLAGVSFIQIPLQSWVNQLLQRSFSLEFLMRWILIAGLPTILISGLVQEATKLLPVIAYWWRQNRNIDPKLALVIGAVAGAGFGMLEAQWVHNSIFAAGWNWTTVDRNGLIALTGFWERFFITGFHAASCALAAYGLARGWGWQFYLLVSILHTLMSYSILFLQSGFLTRTAVEVFIADVALLTTGVVLWLRWRKSAVPVNSADTEEKEP